MVLTSDGRMFCAGGDLKAFAGREDVLPLIFPRQEADRNHTSPLKFPFDFNYIAACLNTAPLWSTGMARLR